MCRVAWRAAPTATSSSRFPRTRCWPKCSGTSPVDEAARQEWGRFLDDLVHELRAPLTAIGGYAALLTDEGLPDPACEWAATIEAQSGRLGRQLEALLAI